MTSILTSRLITRHTSLRIQTVASLPPVPPVSLSVEHNGRAAPSGGPVVLILKRDHLVAESLGEIVRRRLPDAVVHVASCVSDVLSMAASEVDVLVTGISLSDQDTLGLLSPQSALRRVCRAVLVVTSRCEDRILQAVQEAGVEGFLPTSGAGLADFAQALDCVLRGGKYWPEGTSRPVLAAIRPSLPPAEELILSYIGDGCDDETAGRMLGLSPSYIQTVRRSIHRKCGLRHKGDLVKFALQHGYVRMTPDGIVRLFSTKAAATPCRRRPRDTGVSPPHVAQPKSSAAGSPVNPHRRPP